MAKVISRPFDSDEAKALYGQYRIHLYNQPPSQLPAEEPAKAPQPDPQPAETDTP